MAASLPRLVANSGYATALVGKWHLGCKPEFSPNAHGLEYFFGFRRGFTDYYQHTDGGGDSRGLAPNTIVIFTNDNSGSRQRCGQEIGSC